VVRRSDVSPASWLGKRRQVRRRAQIARSPYFFLGARPFREARLGSYIVREHRRGRALEEILDDPYLRRYGSESLIWKVLSRPDTIAALKADVLAAIEDDKP
jgi:hypothetical protein